MLETAKSPRPTASSQSRRHSRPSTTPLGRPPTYQPGSVGQNMPPLLVARTPYKSTTKSPSPNYFGSQEPSPSDTFHGFSPPSSTVRSTVTASPSIVPLDQSPEYDAFRKQSDRNAFSLGGLSGDINRKEASSKTTRPRGASRTEIVRGEMQSAQSQSLDPVSAELGRSPKRVLSPGSAILPEQERRASPASFEFARRSYDSGIGTAPRLSLPLDKSHGPEGFPKARAETLPPKPDDDHPMLLTPQHVVNLLDSEVEQVLLLDVRVSTQHAASHIAGALNLCIPTTLLKRPSFNIKKLSDTFQDAAQKQRFLQWKDSTYIIVYDASSALLKDAQICVNTIKKFRTEGYEGTLYIVKGGFMEFSKRFPAYIDDGADSNSKGSSTSGVDGDGPLVAPVVGGCPMPTTDQPANPFFGNIRQNMDLIGGVGQIPLQHPSKATKSAEKEFPEWLRQASEEQDQGKKVSNKFEAIERREKERMENALSGKVTWDNSTKSPRKALFDNATKVAGIEKGTKNRYNNIYPYEHSRVKLQGVPSSGCDYFNGSWVKAAWSNKQYISTQAPVPATFNDFWNVVWQQDIRVVVMLTAEKEGPQIKSHNYWDQKRYGPFRLDFLSEKRASIEPSRIHRHRQRPQLSKRSSTGPQLPHTQLDSKEAKNSDQPHVIVRRFTLSHEKQPFEPMREITQLQYSSWPDFGAPAHPAHLLGLVEQCNAVVRTADKAHSSTDPEPARRRPVLVHCSAGCGRTGTFCTVDSVIDMIKRQRLARRQQRQTSPMDVESPRRPSDNGGGGGGFFASQSRTFVEDDDHEKDDIDGKWLHRDDVDLVEKTVEDFRGQRISMVQSLRQYVLCYESVMEWLVQEHAGAGE